jgi:hypothetical protein
MEVVMSLKYKLMLVFSLFFLWSGKMYASNELSEKNNLDLIKTRQETISQLISNFKNSNDKEFKKSVIYTLGDLRAKEAVYFLIENIDYGISDVEKRLSKYGAEPATLALSKIGVPSVTPILNAIKKNSDYFKLALLCNALTGINGRDLASFYFRREIKKTKNIDDVAKLKTALRIIGGKN